MPTGVKINDDASRLIVEIGGHVLAKKPALLAAVGDIAARWSHAEAELGRCLATLMDTSPERTFALLKPYKSASSLADGARALARATLIESERVDFDALIERFGAAAEERNRVQHGLWGALSHHPDSLVRLSALDYTRFTVSISQSSSPVRDAELFTKTLSEVYDLDRLSRISHRIEALAIDIILMANRQLAKTLAAQNPMRERPRA